MLLIVWRVVGGVGVGMASVLVPAYIAEIAPADRRGRLGSLQQLAVVVGIFIALLSDFAIAQIAGGTRDDLLGAEAWRWMLWVGAIPALAYGLGTYAIPRSPRFLVSKGLLPTAQGRRARPRLRPLHGGGDHLAGLRLVSRTRDEGA